MISFGIGKVTAKKMYALGIYTGADLRKLEKSDLVKYFGKSGDHYLKIVEKYPGIILLTQIELENLSEQSRHFQS